uniref:Uncharacterized protein n=1 Tax=Mycena chlorophos TaxID=658473 RepID=A0ABQ0LYP8_MYCCL|nr:predicted protein [Mycena chlorophos]
MPQPILKRPQGGRHPPQVAPAVHFSASNATVFATYSSARYDRSAIIVSTNECELPARGGCRTYYDNKQHLAGKSLHPRALAAAYEAQLEDDAGQDDDDEAELERTPTRTSPYIPLPVDPLIPRSYLTHSTAQFVLPPLVPDLSSSSDESDGFISPAPEPAAGYYGNPNLKLHFGHPNIPPPQPFYPSPIPMSSSPPASDRKRRSRRSPSATRRPVVEDGYEEEDLPGSFSHAGDFTAARVPVAPAPRDRSTKKDKSSSKEREGRSRKEKCGVASICRSLAGTSFRDANDGCLGGF